MPATPGTSAAKTIDPAMGLASSVTWDPFFGIEVGRTYVPPVPPEPQAAAKRKAKNC